MTKCEYALAEKFMLQCMQDMVHDKLHCYRVLNYAVRIAREIPKADGDVVIMAALLHDIGRMDELRDKNICHAQSGSQKAFHYLAENNYPHQFCKAVSDCILTHRHKSESAPQTIEQKIIFDADKLDLIGNVGVARAILFGGQIEEPLYLMDENGFPTTGAPEEGASLFREYNRKLCKLSEKLYTKPAKEIALAQQKTMNCYFEGLISEVNTNHRLGQEILGDSLL